MTRKLSLKLDGITPEFIKRDGPQFYRFMKYYFEWLEEELQLKRDFTEFQDIDKVDTLFLEFLKKEFLVYLPETLLIDERKLIKHIRDFYMSKGDENSVRLLFRILFDEEIVFYYPKVDIFKLSHGDWRNDTFIRIYEYDPNVIPSDFDIISSKSTGAKARILRHEFNVISNIKVVDIYISNMIGSFYEDETVYLENVPYGLVSKTSSLPGYYVGTRGFLSEDKKLHDGYYYQEYSYEIASAISRNFYEEILNNLTHPSGTKMFSAVNVTVEMEFDDTIVLDLSYDIVKDLSVIMDYEEDILSEFFYNTSKDITVDYLDAMAFDPYIFSATVSSGKVAVDSNTNMDSLKALTMGSIKDVPFGLFGTKKLVVGHPFFVNSVSSSRLLFLMPTGPDVGSAVFPTYMQQEDLGAGTKISFENDAGTYTVENVYSQNFLSLRTDFVGPNFFNKRFFVTADSSLYTSISSIPFTNSITLNYQTDSYSYFGEFQNPNYVFKGYAGTRYPLNVGASNFDVPIPNGIYDIEYTTTTNAKILDTYRVESDDVYPYNTVAKAQNIQNTIFTKRSTKWADTVDYWQDFTINGKYTGLTDTSSAGLIPDASGTYVLSPANTLARTNSGLRTNPTRTNGVRNSNGDGAVIGVFGSGGQFPTNWSINYNPGNLGVEILSSFTENNLKWTRLRMFGTWTTPAQFNMGLEATASGPAAVMGDIKTASFFYRSKDQVVINKNICISESTSTGAYLTSGQTLFTGPLNTVVRPQFTRTITGATTAIGVPLLIFTGTVGQTIDHTFEVAVPQIETGSYASDPIITTGSAVTRTGNRQIIDLTGKLNYGVCGIVKLHNESITTFGRFLRFTDGTNANGFVLNYGSTGGVRLDAFRGGPADGNTGPSGNRVVGPMTIIFAYAPGFRRIQVIGHPVFGSNQAEIAPMTSLAIGSDGSTAANYNYQTVKKLFLKFGTADSPINQTVFDEMYTLAQMEEIDAPTIL